MNKGHQGKHVSTDIKGQAMLRRNPHVHITDIFWASTMSQPQRWIISGSCLRAGWGTWQDIGAAIIPRTHLCSSSAQKRETMNFLFPKMETSEQSLTGGLRARWTRGDCISTGGIPCPKARRYSGAHMVWGKLSVEEAQALCWGMRYVSGLACLAQTVGQGLDSLL